MRLSTVSPVRIIVLLLVIALAVSTGAALAADALAHGSWTKKSFKIAGTWKIVDEGGTRYVELDAAFKTKKAPDLKLFLHPLPLSAVNGKNAASNGAVLIHQLDSHKGAQRYALPADVDLSQFRTLLVHCEKYSKLWGGAPLR
ncbi:MAG: DM13 domain-containing protein [Acidobacteriota bacterium]